MFYIKSYANWAWLIFSVVILFFVDHQRTASITLWEAGRHWLMGQPLYGDDGRGFIYLPHSAMFYVPFAALPFAWSEALWRILSLSVFAAGLFRFIAVFLDHKPGQTNQYFLLATVISFLLAFDSARNGQIHLLITGLMMFAAVKLTQRQWSKAIFLIVLSFFLKPTAIVFLLLVASTFFLETLLYFLIWGGLFLLLPFLTQSWHYVWGQYQGSINMLILAANTGHPKEWAQAFNLVAQLGWEMPPVLQNLIRVLAALVILYWSKLIRQQGDLQQTVVWVLMLAMNYLMLFNPRTENNDYMMLIPGLSYCLISSLINKKFYHTGFLAMVIIGLAGDYYISNLLPDHHNWAAPLIGLLSLGYLAVWSYQDKWQTLQASMNIVKG